MNPRVAKLEALLARIQTNAARAHAAPGDVEVEVEVAAPPPQAHEFGARVTATPPPEPPGSDVREVEAPLESRARLVAAPRAELEVDEIEADEVLELDERHIVREEAKPPTPPEAAAAAWAEEPEAPPPSSRRPIAEPAETPQEAQIEVAHTPPPESGKQVAVEALSFDDDFTGVRESAQPPRAPAPAPEPSIQLQSLRMPAVQPPQHDEMEAELPRAGEETRPPPGPLPELRAPRIESAPKPEPTHVSVTAEVTRPTRPVAAAQVAELAGTVKPESPKTFGDLLDLALSL